MIVEMPDEFWARISSALSNVNAMHDDDAYNCGIMNERPYLELLEERIDNELGWRDRLNAYSD